MSDVLVRIKRAVLAGNYRFSLKATIELDADGLTRLDVAESILSADAIRKKLRSTSSRRDCRREYLFVIESPNFAGRMLYTKGKLVTMTRGVTYYFLVSAKRSS